MFQNGINVTYLPYQYPITNSLYNGTYYWNISTNTQAGYALRISLDNTWGFDTDYTSAIHVILNGTDKFNHRQSFSTGQWEYDLDMFVAFSVDDSEYVSTDIRLDNTDDLNMINPYCEYTEASAALSPAQGNIQSIAAANITGSRDKNVLTKHSLDGHNFGWNMEGDYPDADHPNTWPLHFTLENVPDDDNLYLEYSCPDWNGTSTCIYKSFDTDKGLDILIAGDDDGETLGICSIIVEYGIFTPTSSPSISPTTPQPTLVDKITDHPSKAPTLTRY